MAQEAVVRMKQFAMKTNSDQQQRINATQVRHLLDRTSSSGVPCVFPYLGHCHIRVSIEQSS